jgi:hypothetical protein
MEIGMSHPLRFVLYKSPATICNWQAVINGIVSLFGSTNEIKGWLLFLICVLIYKDITILFAESTQISNCCYFDL